MPIRAVKVLCKGVIEAAADDKTHMVRQLFFCCEQLRFPHFMGRVPYAQYLRVLQVSAAHMYLSYPFVLSWSLLKAMACGLPIVASNTAPVREVIRDQENGRLVEFFDDRAIAQMVLETLCTRKAQIPMRKRARADAQRYNLQAGVAGYGRAIGQLLVETPHRSSNPLIGKAIALNPRDGELLHRLAAGHSTEHIAALRHRSPATVRNQLSALYQKLGVARRTETIAKLAALTMQ